MFRNLYFLIILVFLSLSKATGQKTIYITLDISGSMSGQKYDFANYGAQVIAVLNNEEKVILIVSSEMLGLSPNKYESIQKTIKDLGKDQSKTEIADIRKFNNIYDYKKKNQYIFIIGDGVWEASDIIFNKFTNHVEGGNLNSTFLEIVSSQNETTSFEAFFRKGNLGKVYKVTSSKEIIDAINIITEEITGVSAIPSSVLSHSSSCITFSPEIALKHLKLLYQDNTKLAAIPEIESIRIDGKEEKFNNIGNPSNETFETKKGGLMSSRIYELSKIIPVGAKVEICFNKNIDKDKLRIFPFANVELGAFNLSLINGNVSEIDANTSGVCKDNTEADVSFEFQQSGKSISGKILETAEVNIVSNGKKHKATFQNGVFKATIPLTGDTTFYSIESELKGYFRENSGIKKIVKTANCEPKKGTKVENRKIPPMQFGSITLDRLNREGKISGQIADEATGTPINPKYFDIELENNYPLLFKDVRIEFKEGNKFDIIIEPIGYWCDCFMPDSLAIKFTATPKEGQLIDGKQYEGIESSINFSIIKEQSWLARCKWLLLSIIGSLMLMWLLLLLSRKDRFRKGAKIVFSSPSLADLRALNPQYISTGYNLRKKGLVAWANRWLNPFGSEKRALNFGNINLSLLFIATKSFKYVCYPKASFDEKKMAHTNYDRDSREPFVKMDENSKLAYQQDKQQLGTIKNFLEYNYPKKSWNDIATYRFFLGFIILLLFAYSIIALFFIIRSLI